MSTKQFLRNSLKKDNLLLLGLVVCTTFAVVPILSFITVFAHEGGHGLLIVPAIILNREIPVMPMSEESKQGALQENPFQNFPIGIFSLFLSFPLGVMANGILLIL